MLGLYYSYSGPFLELVINLLLTYLHSTPQCSQLLGIILTLLSISDYMHCALLTYL